MPSPQFSTKHSGGGCRLPGHQFRGGVAGASVKPVAPGGSGIRVQTSVDGGFSSSVPLSSFVPFSVADGGKGSTGSQSLLT